MVLLLWVNSSVLQPSYRIWYRKWYEIHSHNLLMFSFDFQGGYGSWARGARVVNLRLENLTNVSSYIRLEDGKIIDEFPKMTSGSSKLGQPFKNATGMMLVSIIIGERLMRYFYSNC